MFPGSQQKLGVLSSVGLAALLGDADVVEGDAQIAETFGAEISFELVALMAVVDGFDGLFEADGDEQANDDGGDVDEEVAPGAGGVVRWVDFEHWCLRTSSDGLEVSFVE
jgi:hypothetical protein